MHVGETASYTYYSDGLRASKTIGDNTTKYYYDGDNVVNETLNNNSHATNVMGCKRICVKETKWYNRLFV